MVIGPLQSDRTDQSNGQLSEKAKFIGFIGLLALLAIIMAYISLPLFLQRRLCPPMTVWSEASGSTAVLTFGIILIVAAAFLPIMQYSVRFRTNQPSRPHSAMFVLPHGQIAIIVAMLCGVSALIWVNYLESHYCVTPDQILIRTGLLGSTQLISWGDVTVVRAECGHGRGNFVWSEFRLTFSNGIAMTVPLRMGQLSQDYETVRAAMSGRHYEYRASATVLPSLCPPAVYPLLTNWRLG